MKLNKCDFFPQLSSGLLHVNGRILFCKNLYFDLNAVVSMQIVIALLLLREKIVTIDINTSFFLGFVNRQGCQL